MIKIFILMLKKLFFLRNVNFSPLSGGSRKPSVVIKLIRTHGTKNKTKIFYIHSE